MIEVYIEDETRKLSLDMSELIMTVAQKTAELEGFTKHSEVDILIVSNEEIRRLNKEHRAIDQATDVLSFPMDDFEEDGILGDIVISLERAIEQSEEYGHSLARELGFLTAHGMLHLFGHDHIAPEQEKEMMKRQEQVLIMLDLKRD